MEQQLRHGLAQLGLSPSQLQIKRVLAWLESLQKWNNAYNLTALQQSEDIIQNLVLDSVSLLPHLEGRTVVDVGSGSGVPGMLLAIFAPQRYFTLLDSVGKKTRFLEHCQVQLGLNNVTVVQARAEDFQPLEKFDVVISRALGSLADFLKLTRHLGHRNTRWLAIKGRINKEELQKLEQIEKPWGITHALKARQVPGAANKDLLVLMQYSETIG